MIRFIPMDEAHYQVYHVFGHNLPARAMYEKLGYITTNVQMTKNI